MGIQSAAARDMARPYGLGSDDDIFNLGWDQRKFADEAAILAKEQAPRDVKSAFDAFVSAVRTGTMQGSRGQKFLERRPAKGSYVVFSDHHMTHAGNRQNFIQTSGNLSLYVDVLAKYFDAGFTLVENGDVEDLVVFDPTKAEMQWRLDLLKKGLDDPLRAHQTSNAAWAALDERRKDKRLIQLREIVHDSGNADYYHALREFSNHDRLVRVVGNHDYNLQSFDFLKVLREKLPRLGVPADYLFLSDHHTVRYAILHGHQFDTSCVPTLAPRIGELISESVAWAYQGPDRTWKWSNVGVPAQDWAEGRQGFWDNLVTDDWAKAGGRVWCAAGALIGNLHDPDGWENLFHHNIAWEYFHNSDAQKAVDLEVKRGDGFFKYRHLDEIWLREQMKAAFGTGGPTLLLGHTHEVRYKPAFLRPAANALEFDKYLNSGAAGRFENLLWAVEIVDGEEAVVSWSRPQPRSGKPQRRVYSRMDMAVMGAQLRASSKPIPLPKPAVPEQAGVDWLPAALHMNMRPR